MAPYEALYERKCRSPIGWFDVGETKLLVLELVQQAIEKIVQRIERVTYKLDLPPELEAIHPVFHISMLRKFLGDPSCINPIEDIEVSENLSYEEIPIAILDRQIRKLRTKEVASVKVLWRSNNVEEMTWEAEEDMKSRYPHLFESSGDMLETNMAGVAHISTSDS
nr:PREDICTED: uncharacterized protein LOC107812753 [Nicotiana tabacum]